MGHVHEGSLSLRLCHRSPENTPLFLSSFPVLGRTLSVGSPLMCCLSSNIFIGSKPTPGSPRSPRPGTESCINTWRFLSLQAKTQQGSSNKLWSSVPGKKKHNNSNLSFQLNGESERENLQCCNEGVVKEREKDERERG